MAWHYLTTDSAGWTTPYSQEQEDNAREIWNILVFENHWTERSAAGVLGNMQHESYLNPGQWEIGYNYSMENGMGLGQWTPATKVSDFVGSTNRNRMADGSKQMELLISTPSQYTTGFLNPDGSSVYYNETGLPYISTMSEYSESNQSISDMTKLWAICWEKPNNTYYARSINDRISDAQYWYDKFHGSTPPEPPVPPTSHKMPLWMYLRRL